MFSFKVCYRFDPDLCQEFSLGEKRGENGRETRTEQNRTEQKKVKKREKSEEGEEVDDKRGERERERREREREDKNFCLHLGVIADKCDQFRWIIRLYSVYKRRRSTAILKIPCGS